MTPVRAAFWWVLGAVGCASGQLALQPQMSEQRALAAFARDQQVAQSAVAGGDLDALRRFHAHKRQLCRQAGWRSCQAQATADLADEASNVGKLTEAIALASEATALAAQANEAAVGRWATFVLADALMTNGELSRSHHLGQRLAEESAADADLQHGHMAQMLLGDIRRRRGDGDTAHRHFQAAFALGTRLQRPDLMAVARLYDGLALADVSQGAGKALPCFAEAALLFAQARDVGGQLRALLGQGKALADVGQLDQAAQGLELARQVALARQLSLVVGRIDTELAWVDIGANRLGSAESRARSAVKLAQALEFDDDRWAAHHALGRSLSGRDDAAAAAEYDKAVDLAAEHLTRSGEDRDRDGRLRFGRVGELFQQAVASNLRLGRAARALEIAEISRDTELRRQFDAAQVRARDPALQQTVDAVTAARAEAAAARRALGDEWHKPAEQRSAERFAALSKVAARTDGELRQLLGALRRDHRELSEVLTVGRNGVEQIREALPEGALVVEYFWAGNDAYAFMFSRDASAPRAVTLPATATAIDAAVQQWRVVHGANTTARGALPLGTDAPDPQAAQSDIGRRLYDWLVSPVEAQMARAKTTLIVPFGQTYLLAFHALKDRDGRFALERFRISYLSRAASLRRSHASRSGTAPTLLAVGNPDHSLPGASAEVQRVRKSAFPQARVLDPPEATRHRVVELAGQFRLLHFATHGMLTADATASYLQLADDRLTVHEILGIENLHGKTDLVVLSACDSAVEHGRLAGDPLSIAEAFWTAGVPALVASLWGVDDEATAELMVEFYGHLARGRGDVLDALRQAQLSILRNVRWRDPRFWAAFKLMGDYR